MDYPNLKTNIFNKPIIVVEGIIGAGKTTLTQILEKELDLKAFYEPVDANLYLKEFYQLYNDQNCQCVSELVSEIP